MSDVQKINRIPVVSQLLDVLCQTTGMGFSAITRVTEDQWILCAANDRISFELRPGDAVETGSTLFQGVRQLNKPLVIENLAEDPFYQNYDTPARFSFQSYISVPIFRKSGEFFGTLLALDPKPTKVKEEQILNTFLLFSDLISFHLNSIEEMDRKSANLSKEQENFEIREEFIAVLGHDLRNPIATSRMSAEILLKISDNEIVSRHAGMIKSTSYRMEGMIENLLDFARSRMGNGIRLKREADIPALEKTLQQIIKETQIISPQRVIETEICLEEAFPCDMGRIGQLFSNLLSNADKYGDKEAPVQVKVYSKEGEFVLSVINKGEEIPLEIQENIFEPYYQAGGDSGTKGLGLGLYIASEIAKAHGGSIEVSSKDEETCFSFRCKLQA